jgi:hypothetical protein
MDTGKILMGTAMLLLMIGLVVHPVGAAKTADRFPVGQETVIGADQALPGCDAFPAQPGLVPPFPTRIPYERLTTAPASIPDTPWLAHE